jgi:hypothetical protein
VGCSLNSIFPGNSNVDFHLSLIQIDPEVRRRCMDVPKLTLTRCSIRNFNRG